MNQLFSRYNTLLIKLDELIKSGQLPKEHSAELAGELYSAFPVEAVVLNGEVESVILTPDEQAALEAEMVRLEQTIERICEKVLKPKSAFELFLASLPSNSAEMHQLLRATPTLTIVENNPTAVEDETMIQGRAADIIDNEAHHYISNDEVHNILQHLRLLQDDARTFKRNDEAVDLQSHVTEAYRGLLERIEKELYTEDGVNWKKVSQLENGGFIFVHDKASKRLNLYLDGTLVSL